MEASSPRRPIPPGLTLPEHEHDNPNINFFLSGNFEERVQRRAFTCRMGSVLLKPGGASHSNRYGGEPAHFLILELSPGVVPADLWYTEEPGVAGVGWRLYREMLEPDGATAFAVEELLEDLLARMSSDRAREKAADVQPGWLGKFWERLHDMTAQPDLRKLSSDVEVHPRHLMRAFRRYVGC
jgi:hypothetical protein